MWWTWLACAEPPATVAEPTPAVAAPAPRPRKAGARRPTPKPCLPPPSDVDGDRGAVASQGLAEEQIRAAMSTTFGPVATCAGTSPPSGTLLLSITVGCGGVVSSVAVEDPGDWPPDAVTCAKDVVAATAFPPHALPDGETFAFPYRVK